MWVLHATLCIGGNCYRTMLHCITHLIFFFLGKHLCLSICCLVFINRTKDNLNLFCIYNILCQKCWTKDEIADYCTSRIPSLSSWRVHLCWWKMLVKLPVAMWWGFWLPRPFWWSTYKQKMQKFRSVFNCFRTCLTTRLGKQQFGIVVRQMWNCIS